jgi:hypothetical protein
MHTQPFPGGVANEEKTQAGLLSILRGALQSVQDTSVCEVMIEPEQARMFVYYLYKAGSI